VPADGKVHALRDATATVASTPLIAASVMSKKLAIASDLIVLDVKQGVGAFMPDVDAARTLAEACLALAGAENRRAIAAVTDMTQPLGTTIGNALEVAEAVDVLRGRRRGRLRDLAAWFATRSLALLRGVPLAEARASAERALTDGSAVEAFRRLVEAQSGDPRVVDDPDGVLPRAPVRVPIRAPRAGFVQRVDAKAVGSAASALGAGRHRKGAPIDPAVGIVLIPMVGDRLGANEEIGTVHARTEAAANQAREAVLRAIEIDDVETAPPALVALALGEDPA
jgi:thymidine phosphorylase